MAALKTQRNDGDVEALLAGVADEKRREDCRAVMELMEDVTGEVPTLWGGSIIGFGSYHYVYDSGREGDWFLTGVSPRKSNLSVYITAGFDRYGDLMDRLGKHRTGKSCLYINKLEEIDLDVLRDLVAESVAHMREQYD